MATLQSRVNDLETDMKTLKADVSTIKDSMATIDDMADNISKITKWIKRGLPLVATAAVTSGIVSGKWGAFIQALFH